MACGLAPSAAALIAARLVQGAAGGVLIPQVSGLVQQLFQGEERAKAFGALGATIGISTAVGPLLGGTLIAAFGTGSGWSAVFGRPLVAIGLALVAVGLVATYVTVQLAPGRGVGWAAAVPLLVAGIGSGLVISPNQTLSLSEVPVRRAGTAGAVLQTGQRIGAAAGIAASGTVFFDAVASSRGDFALAFRHGIVVVTVFVVLALVLAVSDVVLSRRSNDAAAAARPGALRRLRLLRRPPPGDVRAAGTG